MFVSPGTALPVNTTGSLTRPSVCTVTLTVATLLVYVPLAAR